MTDLAVTRLYDAMDVTWPAKAMVQAGPWTIREGDDGGQRVSSATTDQAVTIDAIEEAEATMRALGQDPLFCLRDGQEALDALLEARGYRMHDPVALYAIDTAALTQTPIPPVSAFSIWPPLAIIRDLWRDGGIDAARLRVMDRVETAKTAILARHKDQPAGAAFVAVNGEIAMIHAIDVIEAHRRSGVATNIMRKAAFWAQDSGATTLALAVTRSNSGANALYSSLGMSVIGYYHYRA